MSRNMAFWESTDKRIHKKVIRQGLYGRKAAERSLCSIQVKDVKCTDCSIKIDDEKTTEYLGSPDVQDFAIGDANTAIDRLLERTIVTMDIDEESFVTLRLSDSKDLTKIISETPSVTFSLVLKGLTRKKSIWEWTPEEKYQMALEYKESGVKLFKESRFVDAFYKFSKACKLLVTLEPIKDLELEENLNNDVCNLRIILYNNMARCQLSRETNTNYEHAIALCDKVIELEQDNVKALYRRGLAYGYLKNYEKAVQDLSRTVELEPNNALARKHCSEYNNCLKKQCEKSDDIVRRMFKSD